MPCHEETEDIFPTMVKHTNSLQQSHTSHAMEDDTLALRQRLENLPQELYDEIYKQTFTAKPGIRFLIMKPRSTRAAKSAPDMRDFLATRYRTQHSADAVDTSLFPHDHLLYIDPASRRQYAVSYFQYVLVHGMRGLLDVLRVLTPEQRASIKKLYVGFEWKRSRSPEDCKIVRSIVQVVHAADTLEKIEFVAPGQEISLE
ncbi:hypothetical protein CERZMDRAFT_93301 [Cercospora zeae-maydis SCOH1-5]|uniref:Uncharacterized protein n=1 Tax=Cercospora zeae-maydis SCOH1-5 TaxID=717836 RepID=A0A6A6FV38_9PEZI|nr:hypothetical protein CERZMDRAFT_93301 [Cercospora zeae-maydis SCOH1-5]